MSKKKNTLKDLDEFLKQQAATLVTPQPLSEPKENPVLHQPASPSTAAATRTSVSAEDILEELKILSKEDNFRAQLYEIIIRTMEAQVHSLPEDKMLINTALYLKHGENWKEAIRSYWQNAG